MKASINKKSGFVPYILSITVETMADEEAIHFLRGTANRRAAEILSKPLALRFEEKQKLLPPLDRKKLEELTLAEGAVASHVLNNVDPCLWNALATAANDRL